MRIEMDELNIIVKYNRYLWRTLLMAFAPSRMKVNQGQSSETAYWRQYSDGIHTQLCVCDGFVTFCFQVEAGVLLLTLLKGCPRQLACWYGIAVVMSG